MTSPSGAPSSQTAECPHGLRPGTTVCLRCRQEARLAVRQRRRRAIGRAGLALTALGLAVGLGIGAWSALWPEGSTVASDVESGAGSVAEAAQPPPTVPNADAARLKPSIAEGRRDLGDSVYAVRSGDAVTVHFDTELLRTRFDWKFEGVVRATLPLVFGPEVRSVLDSIPAGTLASSGDLLTELPQRGISLHVGDDTLRVWPVTRPGRDGLLVVAYRAEANRLND